MSTHKSKGKLKLTQEDVLSRFREKRGLDYDYSLFVFSGYNSKSKIICRNHGVFLQSPSHHFRGQGCPSCKNERISKKLKKDNSYFKRKASIVHNGFFDYSMVVYDGAESVVSIICPNHGIFNQVASVHLAGHGCKSCAIENLAGSITKDINHFIQKANAVHNNTYDYSESKYMGAREKIKIRCLDHGFFYQDVSNHLAGKGCPSCGLSGFSRSQYNEFCRRKYNGLGNIYLIKCFDDNEIFFKIGITARKNLSLRFPSKKSMPYNYEVIFFVSGSSDFIWNIERKMHMLNRRNKYKPNIHFGGDTECFSKVESGVIKIFREMAESAQLQLIT